MLELKKITKIYQTDSLKQIALDNVSINFRQNEFAAILGQSGSGKTTLLNIIGGLDQYTSGDLVINETSTKKFPDRDWDSYRNHRVGFVFQSYNLITHQSILANVELALTLSGVSKDERKKRAKKALCDVGLEKHINKRPNQLSGGQMQRVAIARALVNDPDIILADEPTGALDSETSTQIMELLKKVAKDKLVIMVTHNPELATDYANRIIRLKDGKIIDDTNPYDGLVDTKVDLEKEKENTKKTSMSLKTALSLSMNNLMTKKGRTFLTAFAGSIGIIGIAMILSLSNGVQEYIDRVQKESLSSYPLSIQSSGTDVSAMIENIQDKMSNNTPCKAGTFCTIDDISINPYLSMQSATIDNNMVKFKDYLDKNEKIKDYVTDIQYTYRINLQLYSLNNGVTRVNPNTFSLLTNMDNLLASSPMGNSTMSAMMNTNVFKELINSEDLLNSQYELLKGKMPSKYNEMVLVLNEHGKLPLSTIYSLDVENRDELMKKIKERGEDGEIDIETFEYKYEDFIDKTFKLVMNTDYYEKNNGKWVDKSMDKNFMENIVKNGEDVKIVGIMKVRDDATNANSGFVGFTHDLTEYIINKINDTDIAKEQLSNKKNDIVTGIPFDGITNKYENSLYNLGVVDLNDPLAINIFPVNYDAKDQIKDIINDYNENVSNEADKITYSDMVGALMSGITTIVNVISYVLIAFVAISLIVSSIMIAIITYISVLERTKEIGILRSIGASKKDVSRLFNAETIIEGLIAGVFGIVMTLVLCIPINIVVNNMFNIKHLASLPIIAGFVLICISVILTVIAGIIPAKMASKRDPVEALRSE